MTERSWVSADHLGRTAEQAGDAEDNAKPLKEWSRAELDAYAAELGIQGADKLGNKGEVIAAIEEREAATEGDDGQSGGDE